MKNPIICIHDTIFGPLCFGNNWKLVSNRGDIKSIRAMTKKSL